MASRIFSPQCPCIVEFRQRHHQFIRSTKFTVMVDTGMGLVELDRDIEHTVHLRLIGGFSWQCSVVFFGAD